MPNHCALVADLSSVNTIDFSSCDNTVFMSDVARAAYRTDNEEACTWATMGYDENVLKADYFMYVPGEMDESIFDSK